MRPWHLRLSRVKEEDMIGGRMMKVHEEEEGK
jgi:hypothetical protein